ncbi:hypothetical protein M8J75_006329 [Diaphorina citri]|nr:hypothetical protein M8J75_006329 [Diaphorina citri]
MGQFSPDRVFVWSWSTLETPHGARVSGVVEETPGRLEYEVALYKEAPARLSNYSNSELPVDQAVPIGTKLQLRARINPHSAWKFVKLMEVTVSPDPDNPHVPGSVALVKDGCRNRDFAAIIPHQPSRFRDRHNEVFLDFEAFLLSTMRERSTLWIHSQIKAIFFPPITHFYLPQEYCLDLFEPSGHGKRRRRRDSNSSNMTQTFTYASHPHVHHHDNHDNDTQYTKFQENIEYTVLMPGDLYRKTISMESSCSTFLLVSGVLGGLLFISAFLMCYLASRLQTALATRYHSNNLDHFVREHSRKCSLNDQYQYTGRSTIQ